MSHAVRISGGNTVASGTQLGTSVTYALEVRDTKTPGGQPAINRLLFVSVGARRTGGGPANTISVTYNGITMTAAGPLNSNTVGNDSVYSQGFYLLESQLPVNGTYNVVATISGGGTGFAISSIGSSYANITQSPPLFVASQQATGSNSVSLSIAHPTDSATFFAQSHRPEGLVSHISDNTQIELADVGVAGAQEHRHSATYTLSDSSIGTPFSTSTSPVTSVDWTKSGYTWDTEDDLTFLETTVSATSTISADLLVPTEIAATLSATSTTSADLFRNRGYVTTVAATAASSDTLDVLRGFISTTTSAASITAQPFERSAKLRTLLEPMAVVTPVFDATRPLSTVINAQSFVEARQGNTFAETQYSPTPGDYVELFEISTTNIGGSDVFRFIPHRFETPDAQVIWKGETFILFPVEAEGFAQQATGAAPVQPTLRVSNVNKFIMAAILELGDLVGAKVTRWRTYARFLDNGETPDPDAHYAPDIYYVQQKTAHTREGFEFTLSSALDLPGIKLPRRQILKDQSSEERNLYAPGAANIRFRGR